jgi:hypothetical protein
MEMTIKNKNFRKAMDNAGFAKIQLVRSIQGYHYLYSDDNDTMDILMNVSTSIPVCYFSQQTIATWVSDVRDIWDAANKSQLDRQ